MSIHSLELRLADCTFELLQNDDRVRGLGRIRIGATPVRSGRLPLSVTTETFTGLRLDHCVLRDVKASASELRVVMQAVFVPAPTRLMRDHSFDPIHDTTDWDVVRPAGAGELSLVIRPAADQFNGQRLAGFSYHWEYHSLDTPLFYLMDRASWELGGDIEGVTCYSQSSCSDPVVTFGPDTAWTTEGVLFFLVEQGNQNPIMTHNLPRFASHGSFDFQFKGDHTLAGVFEEVNLIRSLLRREPGTPELKCFDKHLFDQALTVRTTAKKIMLSSAARSVVDQQNLWTWMHSEIEERARRQFGLRAEPFYPIVSQNYWVNFTADSYFQDLVPAAASIGCRQVFVDNLKKSAMTERAPMPGVFNWNMCCGHEYEIAPQLGGEEGVRRLVEKAAGLGVTIQSWTNNDQALSSPLNRHERAEGTSWYVLLEDCRQKYGGAYAGCMSVLDFSVEEARRYFVDTHVAIRQKTGLNWYLFDSFYNLAFMPVSYANCQPRTMWQGLLHAFKELQDHDVHFTIESFGPFGSPQHGHPSSYNFDTIFICCRVGVGNDYTTVPGNRALKDLNPRGVDGLYYALAHMALRTIPLFVDVETPDGKTRRRIDEVWTDEHRRVLREYHDTYPDLHTRYLQQDGLSVLWHNADGTAATLWNFADRDVILDGEVTNLTRGKPVAAGTGSRRKLRALYTYAIKGSPLPTAVVSADTPRSR